MSFTEVMATIEEVLKHELVKISDTSVTVATVLIFLIVVIVTFTLSSVFKHAIRRGFKSRGIDDEGKIGITSRLVHYSTVVIGLAIGFNMLGIDLTGLFAAGAVFGVVIAFAMQNISQNFVSGVILLAERTIKPGDILEVEGKRVRVVNMGIRATIAVTRDNEEIIIPNSILVQSMVTNYTLGDRLFRLSAVVGVAYESDMKLVLETLERVARELPWRHQERDSVVQLREFGNSSVNFRVSVWIDDPWGMHGRGLSLLNEAIWWGLKNASITIAFPQVDVHFDRSVEKALSGLDKNN